MKKAFTLIELLAVIIILAIVALIATPIILDLISDSEQSANMSQAHLLVGGAEFYYIESTLNSSKEKLDGASNLYDDIKTSSEKPSDGIIKIKDNGDIYMSVFIDGLCYVKDFDKVEIEALEISEDECNSGSATTVKPDYTESTLNGSDPVLATGLIPVIISDNGDVLIADLKNEWYNYSEKKWANAITLKDSFEVSEGEILSFNDERIAAYYVWIPRYEYQLFDIDAESISKEDSEEEQEIMINFVGVDSKKELGTPEIGNWYTHPAFTVDGVEISGLWVGKFEMTGTLEVPTILPNVASLREQTKAENVSGFYYSILNKMDNEYGLTDLKSELDSHMLKNIEWGAIAYLSHSKYGINKEVSINGNSQFITGCGSTNVSSSTSTKCINQYGTVSIYPQSTTDNISGIFDLVGGGYEFLMGNMKDDSGSFITKSSGFTEPYPDIKYYDAYEYSSSNLAYSLFNYGEGNREVAGWYSDNATYPTASYPWIARGGVYYNSSSAGIFSFTSAFGLSSTSATSRAALWIY